MGPPMAYDGSSLLYPIAYFSMEIGLEPVFPTYAGGLGVLAGDTLRAAADSGVPMLGITLLYRKGYFRQHLDSAGNQSESEAIWEPEKHLEPVPVRVEVMLEGRPVKIGVWKYLLRGISGHEVPVYFLDADLQENTPSDRRLTDCLYGPEDPYRFSQEAILGLGGVEVLKALGLERIQAFHMNEGHSALLILALAEGKVWEGGAQDFGEAERERVRDMCIFTTHTPVPEGHDRFPMDLVRRILGEDRASFLLRMGCCSGEVLNMTHLALHFSRYINGVALQHGETSRSLFPNYPIDSVTNGVHAVTWTAPPFQRLYDRHIPAWRTDNLYLRYAIKIPLEQIIRTHREAKESLLAEVQRRTGIRLDPEVLTLCFARRATAYKRIDLLFSDLERLKRLSREIGPLQMVCAGKAHPKDTGGKEAIRRIWDAAAALKGRIPVVYLEEYDISWAKLLCSGADLWLNTPQKPQEASGTSGMKAALNGVPSFSVLDGWWVEGHVEDVTGWSIGDGRGPDVSPHQEVASLYGKLERVILPLFYGKPDRYAEIMRSCIALNGSFFNAQRMLAQYIRNAYTVSQFCPLHPGQMKLEA